MNDEQRVKWLAAVEASLWTMFEMLAQDGGALDAVAAGEKAVMLQGGDEPGFVFLDRGAGVGESVPAVAGLEPEMDANEKWMAGAFDQIGRFFVSMVFESPKWTEQWFAGDFKLEVSHEGFVIVADEDAGDLPTGQYL